MPKRDYDVVLYGATGFTGRLVADYLAKDAPDGLRWAIGGRSEEKLIRIADELVAEFDCERPGILIANSHTMSELSALAKSTKVVISTVGPYAALGSDLVAACVAAGTHYTDLTGEPIWVRRMIDEHHMAAVRSNTAIVCSAGFDCIPADLGTLVAARHLHSKHNLLAESADNVWMKLRGGFSGGTIASAIYMVEKEPRKALGACFGNVGYLTVEGRAPPGAAPDVPPVPPSYDSAIGKYKINTVMAAVNTRHVHRTRSLFASDSSSTNPFSPKFSFEEHMAVSSWFSGFLQGAVTALFMLALALSPTRWLLKKVLPKPGEGPSAEDMAKGYFEGHVAVESTADPRTGARRRVTSLVRINGDPGYAKTAVMLANTGISLALVGVKSGRGGVVTAGYAIGDALVERLTKNTDIVFRVIEDVEV
jgi:short subunit dehydrogenase-like uncharacterized protein